MENLAIGELFNLFIKAREAEGVSPEEILLDLSTAYCVYAEQKISKERAQHILDVTMSTWMKR